LKNGRSKLLLIQLLKRTIGLDRGAVGTPGAVTKKSEFSGRWLSTRRTKTTRFKKMAQSSLSHDDEGEEEAKKSEKNQVSLSSER
jgi:hypothetical protein